MARSVACTTRLPLATLTAKLILDSEHRLTERCRPGGRGGTPTKLGRSIASPRDNAPQASRRSASAIHQSSPEFIDVAITVAVNRDAMERQASNRIQNWRRVRDSYPRWRFCSRQPAVRQGSPKFICDARNGGSISASSRFRCTDQARIGSAVTIAGSVVRKMSSASATICRTTSPAGMMASMRPAHCPTWLIR
jgi:hypothetical protein